jgi:hypothetical protein
MFTPFAFVKSVAAAPAFDPNAQAYLNAVVSLGGTTNTTINNAVNTLFVDLKSAGLYSKIFAMYPMIGIASASQALNAKDPTPISSSFYIDYLNPQNFIFSSSGIIGGASTGCNTFIVDSVNLTNGNKHLAVYSNADRGVTSIGYEWGAGSGTTNVCIVSYGGTTQYSGFGAYVTSANTSPTGFYVAQITGSRQSNFKNGTEAAFATSATDTNSNNYLGLMCDNRSVIPLFGSSGESSDKSIAFASVGQGLSSAENTSFYNIVEAFQTSLGRNA